MGWAEFVQWGLIVLGTSALVPVLFFTKGSYSSVAVANTPSGFADLIPSLPPLTLISLTIGGSLWILADPAFTQRFLAAESRSTARKGVIFWIITIYPWWVIISALGTYGAGLMPDANSQTILITMTREAFPPVIAAIVIVGILSATLSTADSQVHVISSMFVNDVYRPFRSKASDAHYLRMVRIVTVVGGIIAVIMTPLFTSSILATSLRLQNIFIAAVVPVVIGGIIWSEITEKVAFISSVFGGIITVAILIIGGLFGIPAVYFGLTISIGILITGTGLEQIRNQKGGGK